MAPPSLLPFLFLCYFPLLLLAQSPIKYYGKCPLYYHCPKFKGGIYFPLTNKTSSECGLRIKGCEVSQAKAQVQLGNQRWYEIMESYQMERPYSILVQDKKLQGLLLSRNCIAMEKYNIPPFPSSTIPFQISNTIVMYKCNRSLNIKVPDKFFTRVCYDYSLHYNGYPDDDNMYESFNSCSKIQLPIDPKFFPHPDPFKFFTSKLILQVKLSEKCLHCHETADICLDNGTFYCSKDSKAKSVIVAATVSEAVGAGILLFVIYCCRFKLFGFWKNRSKAHQDFEAFLKSHGPLAVRRYNYSDIKKITKSFNEKLGQGGYGGVFKGMLDDGCQVAVKILSESKGNGEEFINEVASISRTSHVNIVTLLGFCFEGKKRALVYEYMPNGSLEKFIYETNPLTSNHRLDTEILYQITIGVARGLEYLHKGCNTRILHFDIKPHNIFLDENFCPKISDFGLAKICPRRESIISMIGTRGTIGYIAPEVFNRNFGGVSHKSDVYSYGMMVLEMVGARRKNNNVEVDCTSEIYFPHWIYKRLELNEEFSLQNIINENDKDKIRKMVIVSLWCIQAKPADRPTMGRVIEMLEGRVEMLQIPPKPFFSSPPRSPTTSSTHSCDDETLSLISLE